VSDELKVYTKKETQKLLGLSGRTWDRLEALGETRRRRVYHQIESVTAAPTSPHGSTPGAKPQPPAS
jgi:hypothetical protein